MITTHVTHGRVFTALLLCGCCLVPLACIRAGTAGQEKEDKRKKSEPPALPGSLLVADKGKFSIAFNGQLIGTEEFEIVPTGAAWLARGATEVRTTESITTRVSARYTLLPRGLPQHYEWVKEPPDKSSGTVDFQGSKVTAVLRLEGAKPFQEGFVYGAPLMIMLDKNFYHHYAILARLYDWNAKGEQAFSTFVPQDMVSGPAYVKHVGMRKMDGADYETLSVAGGESEVVLYCDASHRLMGLSIPDSRLEVRRK